MGARTWAALAAATIVVGVGCRQIIGIGDPVFNGSTGAGGAGSSSSSGTGGAVVSTGTGGSGACRVTHPGGGACEYLPGMECGCAEAGQKCTVIDPTTGESACLTAGTTADYDACTSSADCKAGSWCELSTLVCEPICVGTCAGGTCVPAAQASTGMGTIPGLEVCAVSCDLVAGSPCGASATCVTVMASAGTTSTECAKSGNVQLGDPCSTAQDCAAGDACTEDPITSSSNCSQWCRAGDDPCPAMGETCHNFQSPTVTVGGHDYGYCSE